MRFHFKLIFKFIFVFTFLFLISKSSVYAASDPRLVTNNKVGIGVLSPEAEIEEASELVNTNGDWGYILLIIKRDERNLDRWQNVFHLLSKNHLIPIVRLATEFDGNGYWERPKAEDAKEWADFLSKLYWPVKNRYVQVYNEVNRDSEWGGKADPADYALELNKIVDELKNKDENFFVLSSPLDLAAPTSAESISAPDFFSSMEVSSPGIFSRLDGWASHSYPNPDFSQHPLVSGRTAIDGYKWELDFIKQYLGDKDLPVFITETGWRMSEDVGEETISRYYDIAFSDVWSDKNVAAVTPFVLNYYDPVFGPFSFSVKNDAGDKEFRSQYFQVKNLFKEKGEPEFENKLEDFTASVPMIMTKGKTEDIRISFRNAGNDIWVSGENIEVHLDLDGAIVEELTWISNEVLPGQVANISARVEPSVTGDFELSISAASGEKNLILENYQVKVENRFTRLVQVLRFLI